MKIMRMLKHVGVILLTLAGLATAAFALLSFKHKHTPTQPMVCDLTY